MSAQLVVMRLADMHKMHPQQDNSKVCSLCDQPVGIYPSGQSALKVHPTLEIVCSVCAQKDHDPKRDSLVLAAEPKIILQETRDSYVVKKA